MGLDLSGRLASWRRRYRDDVREFDYRDVWCTVTSWWDGRRFTVSATARCNDPHVENGGMARFYSAPGHFMSRAEADAHIDGEARRAALAHPGVRFHRQVQLRVLEAGRLAEVPVVAFEFCLDGNWQRSDPVDTGKTCVECGLVVDRADRLCPRCGAIVA